MIRLLITGANGFIGRHCLAALVSSDCEIHAITTKANVAHGELVHWHQCDLLDVEASRQLIGKIRPTHLLHLAWIATPGVYWTSPLNEIWKAVSLKLAESFIAFGGERIIGVGTCAEYDWTNGICVESELHPHPPSPYAQAKLSLSQELAGLAAATGVGLAWLRLFWIYGPHEPRARLIPSIILSLLQGQPALCTAGTHRRDYLHVRDVARAIATIVPAPLVGPVNIASGNAPLIASLATAIAAALNKPHLLRLGAITPRLVEPPLVVANIERLTGQTAWRPRIPWEIGLSESIQWWSENLDAEHDRVGPASLRAPARQGSGEARVISLGPGSTP